MNTDQSTIATNGAVHASVGESFVDYPARARAEIKPGAEGSIPYRLRRAANIVDVTSTPDFEIISAAFGRRRIDLRALAEQAGGVVAIANVLTAEPCEVSGGTFCVIKVRNKASTPKQIEISLRVSNEHGPEIEDKTPFNLSGGGTAAKPNGRAKPRSKEPRSKEPSSTSARSPRSPKVQGAGHGDTSRKKERDVAEAITVPVFTQPPPGNKIIVLSRYYVTALYRFFSSRTPIDSMQRPVIVRGLARAHRREAGSPAGLRPGEVAIVLPEADVEHLYRAIQRTGEYKLLRSGSVSVMRSAIKKALTGKSGDVVAAPVKKLAVTSLVHPTPPGMNGEDHGEPDQETAAMLAGDLDHD